MKKRYITTFLAIFVACFALCSFFSCDLYAESKEKVTDILDLIDEGSSLFADQKYLLALQKYKEAMAASDEILSSEPANGRISLLKELLVTKIKECKSEIANARGYAGEDVLYDDKIGEIYELIDRADNDRKERRLYVALKEYAEAGKRVESVLEKKPDHKEALLLSAFLKKRKTDCLNEIDSYDAESAKTRLFSKKWKDITGMMKNASEEEEKEKFLISLREYKRALSALKELEEEFPESGPRISIAKEMAQLGIEGVKEKIEKLEKEIESGILYESEKSAPQEERLQPQSATSISYKLREEKTPGKGREAKSGAFEGEKPPQKVVPAEKSVALRREPASTEEKVRPSGSVQKTVVKPEKPKAACPYLINFKSSILDFITHSRTQALSEAERGRFVNSERLSRMKKGLGLFISAAGGKIGAMKAAFMRTAEKTVPAGEKTEKKMPEGKEILPEEIPAKPEKPACAPEEIATAPEEPESAASKALEGSAEVEKSAPEVESKEGEIVPETADAKKVSKPIIPDVAVKAPQIEGEWVQSRKNAPTGYDFSEYRKDPDIIFIFEGKGYKFSTPCLRKGNEIWVPVNEFTKMLGLTFLKAGDQTVVVIRYDGTPLEMNVGDVNALVNKKHFSTMPRPLALLDGAFMLSLDSMENALDITSEYNASDNSVKVARQQKLKFETFTVEKPAAPPKEENKMEIPRTIIPELPREMRNELLPPEYSRDVDLKLDTSFKYYEEMLTRHRTRYNEYYLSGKLFDLDVFGHLSMKDYDTSDKRTFKEDGQHLSFAKGKTTLKMLDNFMSLPGVKTQSQSYWGVELFSGDTPIKTTFWAGEMDPFSIPSSDGETTVRYKGQMYASKQDWIDTEKFRLSAVELFTHSESEFFEETGLTNYPRNNFVYLLDSDWEAYPGFHFNNTFAQSTYMPDNERGLVIGDYDFKSGIKYTNDRFNINSSFEYIGDRYVSLSIPSSYQDYMGWDLASNFNISDNLTLSFASNISRDNVAFNKSVPTTDNNGVTANAVLSLPWGQSLNAGWSYNNYYTSGGGQDATGSEYKSYRLDYYKTLGQTASLQLGWLYYRSDPLASSTGSTLYNTYSATIYKNFPELNGSYIRVYQDLTQTKQLSMDGLPSSEVWNTSVSGKYYILPYLSFSGDLRIQSAYQATQDNTAIMSISTGLDYNPSPSTSLSLTYEVDNMDLYDKYRTTRDWSVLFLVRHAFDVQTPEKWGKVRVSVFEDLNGNNIMDEGEKGLEGILAYIVSGRGARTNTKGVALIKNVVPGERKVRLDLRKLPVDMVIKGDTSNSITVKPLKITDTTFVVVTTGKITGRIFVDINKDGVFEKSIDVPIPNARLVLSPDSVDTLSFSDGSYLFDYIYPGLHQINIDMESISKDY
ncbi:MAG: hypothetical protein JW994_06870, partial [Candidatus Omnitrophica bacterium]|nr:hypothetical protein [Candidatus Omnitrophota bacterium]